MNIPETLKIRLKNNTNISMNENTFKKLLENCFSALTGNQELHNINSLFNSKPDVVKNAYAALLTISAEFARNDITKEGVRSFLVGECGYTSTRATLFSDLYECYRQELQIALGSIGTHLPHIIDLNWKIDYIVKSHNLDQADGPLFRICLVVHSYDQDSHTKKVEHINFSCTSQELQDLVYKLKDAVRHCQRLIADH